MAIGTQHTVVAVFKNRTDADKAAAELRANGFDDNDIYIGSYNDTAAGSDARTWEATRHHAGGIKGWFESLFGHHDEDTTSESDYYEDAANRGGVILSVDVTDENLDRVGDIIDRYNPIDVKEEQAGTAAAQGQKDAGLGPTTTTAAAAGAAGVERTGSGFGRAAQTGAAGLRNAAAGVSNAARNAGSELRGAAANVGKDAAKSIPVVQEQLSVGKRSILRGGVRVYSRVREQPVEETVRLREERVRVDRQPVDREVRPGELTPGRDQVIEVQEFAEEPVVQKQARVVEEVRVNKEAAERTETVRDTVRRTEVEVENLAQGAAGSQRGTANLDDDFRNDFQSRYANSGAKYEDYGPAYQYGYQAASDPRYQGRSWDEIESDLRNDYGQRYPNSAWERMKDSIRYGWDKVTGRARGAATR
jgi:uncharacterized protein (TIGR02271 family)